MNIGKKPRDGTRKMAKLLFPSEAQAQCSPGKNSLAKRLLLAPLELDVALQAFLQH